MLNSVNVQGRLTKDPQTKQTQGGKTVLSFTLACDRDYVAKGQERQTDFISCIAWGHTAEFIAKYFTKGREILVSGNIQTRSYDDKDGKKVYVTEVLVTSANFCGSKAQADSTEPASESQTEMEVLPIPPMGLPFDIG